MKKIKNFFDIITGVDAAQEKFDPKNFISPKEELIIERSKEEKSFDMGTFLRHLYRKNN